jgi:hypothetical protein
MKKFIIKDEIFKTETLFIVNCSYQEFRRVAKKYGGKIDDEFLDSYICGTVIRCKNFFRIVWVEKVSKKPSDIGDIVHELFHLVVRILEDKGVPIKANTKTGECGDETHAYLLESYVRQFLEKI